MPGASSEVLPRGLVPRLTLQQIAQRIARRQYAEGKLFARWRAARMQAFLDRVQPPPHARIIDLGGTNHLWELIEHDFEVTLVNRADYGQAGSAELIESTSERIRHLEGDACDLRGVVADQSYDLAFSNSVIEHVGDEEAQLAFANEVQRIAPAWWIQTPSDRCPIEPHSGVPFYWSLPEPVLRRLHANWRRDVPAWQEMMESTRVLSRARMLKLFPTSEIFAERRLGFEKSYAAYRPCPNG
jgi:hypothetical protein